MPLTTRVLMSVLYSTENTVVYNVPLVSPHSLFLFSLCLIKIWISFKVLKWKVCYDHLSWVKITHTKRVCTVNVQYSMGSAWVEHTRRVGRTESEWDKQGGWLVTSREGFWDKKKRVERHVGIERLTGKVGGTNT